MTRSATRLALIGCTLIGCTLIGCVLAGCATEPAALTPEGSWTLVVLPDTQYAVASYPEVVEAQVDWILAHRAEWNVRAVLHVGDLTDRNTDAEWQTVRRTLGRLPPEVPFVVIPGNHDLGDGGSANDRTSGFYTGLDLDAVLGPTVIDHFPATSPTSFVHELETPDGPWQVAALEFGPRTETIAWARDALSILPPRPTIVLTHAYLTHEGSRFDHMGEPYNPHDYGVGSLPGGAADGEDLWSQLVQPAPAASLVVCGHDLGGTVAHNTSVRPDGRTVHELFANFQELPEGGSGYLVLVELTGRQLRARFYSPYLDHVLDDAEHDVRLELAP